MAVEEPTSPPEEAAETDPPKKKPGFIRTALRLTGVFIRRLLIGTLILVLLLLLSVALITQTNPGRRFLANQIESNLSNRVFRGTITIGQIRGPIFGRIRVADVTITDEQGAPVITLDGARVKYAIGPLFRREVIVTDVMVEGLQVDAAVLDDGSLNVSELMTPPRREREPSGNPPPLVRVEQIALDDIGFRLEDRRSGATLVGVHELIAEAELELHPTDGLRVAVSSLDAGVEAPALPQVTTTLALRDIVLVLVDGEIAVEIGSLGAAGFGLASVNGRVRLDPEGGAPFEDVELTFEEITGTPEAVNPWYEGPEMMAPFALGGRIHGPPDAVEVQLDLTGPSEVQVRGSFDITEPANLGYRARVVLQRFRPQEWLDVPIEGDVSLGLGVTGRGITPQDANLRVRLDIGPSRVEDYELERGFISAAYGDETLRVDVAELWALHSGVTLRGTAGLDGAIDISLRADSTDLSVFQEWIGPSPTLDGRVTVELDAEGVIPIEEADRLENDDPLAVAEDWLSRLAYELHIDARSLDVDGIGARRLAIDASGERGDQWEATVSIRAEDLRTPALDLQSVTINTSMNEERARMQVRATENEDRRLSLRFEASHRDDVARVDLTSLIAAYDGVSVAIQQPATIRVPFTPNYEPEQIDVEGLRLRVADAVVTVDGSYVMSGRIDVDAAVEGLELASLRPVIPGVPAGLAGGVDVRLSARGPLAEPDIELSLNAVDLTMDDAPEVSVELTANVEDQLGVFQLTADAFDGRLIELRGRVPLAFDLLDAEVEFLGDAPLGVTLRVPSFDLGRITPFLGGQVAGLQGVVSIDAGASGLGLDRTAGYFVFRLQDFGVDVPAGDDTVALRDVDFEVSTRYDPAATGAPGFRVDLDLDWAGDPVLRLDTDVAGDIREVIEDPSQGLTWFSSLQGTTTVEIPTFDIRRLPGFVREAAGIETGTLDFYAAWSGGATSGELLTIIDVANLQVSGLEPITTNLRITSSRTTDLEFTGQYGSLDPVELEGHISQSFRSLLMQGPHPDKNIGLRLSIPSIELGSLALVSDTFEGQPGRLGGYIDIFGTPSSPELRGRLALRDLPLLDGSMGLLGVELRYADRVASAEMFACEANRRGFEGAVAVEFPDDIGRVLVGRAPMPTVDQLGIDGEIQFEDTELITVLPEWLVRGLIEDPEGTIDGQVRVAGYVDDPQISGSLEVAGATIGIIPISRTLSDLNVAVDISNDAIDITELRVGDSDAGLEGNIHIALEDFELAGTEGQFRVDNFFVPIGSEAGVFIDGGIELTSTQPGSNVLQINVTLVDMSIDVPTVPGGLAPRSLGAGIYIVNEDIPLDQVGRRNPRPLGAEEATIADETLLRIRVQTDGTAGLRHQLAELEFGIELDIEMQSGEMTTKGELQVEDGVLHFVTKDFSIERGIVRFDGTGSQAFDPTIDFEAVHTLAPSIVDAIEAQIGVTPAGENGTISITVRGRASRIVEDGREAIQFSSDPGMSDDDILFVLLTDRPGTQQGEVEQQALARVAPLLAGILADRFGGNLPVDIRVEGGGGEDSQLGISRVEGVRRITDNLNLVGAVITSPKDEESNRYELALEWIIARFRRNTIQAEVWGGDRGEAGIELLYNVTVP